MEAFDKGPYTQQTETGIGHRQHHSLHDPLKRSTGHEHTIEFQAGADRLFWQTGF